MANGVVMERHMGTPQGGPLSPLLANVLLDEVDKELELRGHAFVRYADDCNVYVRSRRAGQRVMQAEALVHFGGQRGKERVWDRQFLGYSFWGREAPGQQEGPDEVQGASPADYKPEWRAEPATRKATALRAGVEGILRLSGYIRDLDQWMHRSAAYVAITPVETGKDSVPGVASRCERNLAWRAARFAGVHGPHHALHMYFDLGVLLCDCQACPVSGVRVSNGRR